MGKGFSNDLHELLSRDPTRFMIHSQRMEILNGRRGSDSRMSHQRSLSDEVVEGQEDIPDIEDDGLYLGHRKRGF